MATYLVIYEKEYVATKTCELVGLFCASDDKDLFNMVDEQTSPYLCLYAKLKPGEGIFTTGLQISPDPEEPSYATTEINEEAELTERFVMRLFDGKVKWLTFDRELIDYYR